MTGNMAEYRRNKGTTAAKEKVAVVSMLAIGSLIILKIVASVITGSVGILADTIHSVIDFSGAVIGFIGVRVAGKPADEGHSFGHGKAENIAGVVIAVLIFLAAGTIVYQAVRNMIGGAAVEMVTAGIYMTAVAIVINLVVSRYTLRAAQATDSVALEATGRDLFADVLSSCAVLIGLILVRITGLNILDPVVALLVAALIARTAFFTMKKAFGGLIDTKLPENEETAITSSILEYQYQVAGFHALRTRKAGSQRYIDLHLVMYREVSLEQAHQVCDRIESEIQSRLPESSVTIHIEPCGGQCQQCSVICARQQTA